MDEDSTTAPVGPSPSRTLFGTCIPSSITFGVAILLFFLPFIDIKCNTMHLRTVSGIELATGFSVDKKHAGNLDEIDEPSVHINNKREDPNSFALVAFVLAIAGFGLSFFNRRAGGTGGVITGILSAAALVGLYTDITRDTRLQETANPGEPATGFERLGERLTEGMKVIVEFTPWFYIAIIALLAAALLSYRRMK